MVTLSSNYKEVLDSGTVEKIEEFIEDDGYDLQDMLEFIDNHSEPDFVEYYEEYLDKVEEYGEEVVEDFISEFYIESLDKLEEVYQGNYDSAGDFAEQYSESMGYSIPDFIVVNWEETYHQNLFYDFVYTENGNVFIKNW